MKMTGEKRIFIWLFWAFYVLTFFLLLKHSLNYLDPDFGWHIKLGQEMLATFDVPRVNLINYTIYNISWVDHEWLSNLLTYSIYNRLGYSAVNIFFALLALGAFLIQYFTAKKFFALSDGAFLVFLPIQFFGIYASLPSLGVRMQEFTLIFLAILLFIFYSYEKTANKKILFFLPIIFWLWSSLHGGFLLGLGLLGFFVFIKSVENIIFKFYRPKFLVIEPLSFRKIFTFAIFSALSAVATLLTPYGFKLYEFLTSYRNDYYLGMIFEWFHQFRYPFFYWQLAFLELLVLVFTWWALKNFWLKKNNSQEKISLWSLFLLGLFTAMAIRSRRHFPLLAMFSVPLITYLLATWFGLKNFSFPEKISVTAWLDRGIKVFFIFIFIVGVSLQLLSINLISDPWKKFASNYPYEAVQYLKNHQEYDDLRLFNEFNWGGYLIWTLPGKQLFIDGRLPQYEYKGHSLLEEFYEFFSSTQAEKKLDEYEIKMVLLSAPQDKNNYSWLEKNFLVSEKNKNKKNNEPSPLDTFLSSSSGWRLVYGDGLAKIFIKLVKE